MKKYLILIACVLLTIIFIGCSGEQSHSNVDTNSDTNNKPTERMVVTFNTNCEIAVPQAKVTYGSPVELPIIQKDGYVLDGWYYNEQKWIEESSVTQNMILEAKWIPLEYKITYHNGEGTVHTYTIEDEIELPCVYEKDYMFVGWSTNENGENPFTTIKKGTKGNLELYAVKADFQLDFTEKSDGTYEISSFKRDELIRIERVVIPGSYNGKPVTSIGDYVFEWLDFVTTIEIPSNIKKIGIRSFANTSATKLIVNEGVEEIERSAFSGSDLQEVQLADSITVLNEYAFSNCGDLKTINIPKNLTFLGLGAFGGCAELSIDVVIPEGITEIWDDAFRKCEKIKSVKFHNKITYIGSNSFRECFAIKEIEIYSGSIDLCAFYYCVGLEKVMIHKEVESINSVAFDFVEAPIYTDATEKPENWHIDVVLNYTPSEES